MDKKNFELSRVRTGAVDKQNSLEQRVDALCELVQMIVRASIVDLGSVDLVNFSDYGLKQLDARIKKVIEESAAEESGGETT